MASKSSDLSNLQMKSLDTVVVFGVSVAWRERGVRRNPVFSIL